MPRTIVVGVDGGPGGLDAIALARRLCPPGGELVAVAIGLRAADPLRVGGQDDFDRLVRAEAHGRLADLRAASPELRTEVLVAETVAVGLHAAAAALDAELLVLGSCRRGRLGRVFAGDDVRQTLRHAACPVAVAPRDEAMREAAITTIGVGWSADAESEAALAYARRLAADLDGELHAVTVVNVPTWPVAAGSPTAVEVLADVADAAEHLADLEDVEATTIEGVAVDELAAFGDEVDLLVVGAHERGPLARIALGSASEALARSAVRPLIVVPAPAAPTAPRPPG